MDLPEILAAAWGAIASVVACVGHYRSLRSGASLPWLRRVRPVEPAHWPRISVIVPAKDEGRRLREALATLLEQDYPDLQIVLVDDRSTDDTGRIMDEVAAADSRVAALHVQRLPSGWLGKVHALDAGARAADGEWLLFTDADVFFLPGALRKAMAYALDEGLDHLTVPPDVHSSSLWQEVMSVTFGTGFLQTTRATDVPRGGSDAFVGVGAFNLVRRDTFASTPGFEWLRLEVLDDMGVGLMIKRAGGRSALALGQGLLEIWWYESLGGMVRGLEKNLFAVVGRYSVWRTLAWTAGLLALVLGPLVAIWQSWLPVRWLGAAAFVSLIVLALAVRWATGKHFWATLLTPVGSLLVCWALLRSAFACSRRGGVSWRGTFYPLAELRKGQRVRL